MIITDFETIGCMSIWMLYDSKCNQTKFSICAFSFSFSLGQRWLSDNYVSSVIASSPVFWTGLNNFRCCMCSRWNGCWSQYHWHHFFVHLFTFKNKQRRSSESHSWSQCHLHTNICRLVYIHINLYFLILLLVLSSVCILLGWLLSPDVIRTVS